MSKQVALIPAKGIDRAVPFTNKDELARLREYGYTFICRYLSKSRWKTLTKREATLITQANMYVVVVYQNSNNRADYFSKTQGIRDAHDAVDRVVGVGAPSNAVIYFAVDYDTRKDIRGVYEYFKGVAEVIEKTSYRLGVYGSYHTCSLVPLNVPQVKFKWQTIAWSKVYGVSQVCNYSLYQHACDTIIPESKKDRRGVMRGYDLNKSNGAGGGWKVEL